MVALASDVVLYQGSIRCPGDDPVSADILEIVVTNHHMQTGKPAVSACVIAIGGNRRAVHSLDDISLDHQSIEAGRRSLASGAEDDAPIVLDRICPAYVVNIKVREDDVLCRSEVVEKNMDTATNSFAASLIGDLQMMQFDLLCIV